MIQIIPQIVVSLNCVSSHADKIVEVVSISKMTKDVPAGKHEQIGTLKQSASQQTSDREDPAVLPGLNPGMRTAGRHDPEVHKHSHN
jgi:hypothetical protein